MPSPQIERKLAAIMFTDIAGYTKQMSKDEAVAISLLNKQESILKPLIAKHNGTYVKSTGDGSLSYFNSAVNAATCAIKLQSATYDDKNMNIRVGIDIGDIVFKEGDVFGGGVNVASRLESIAPAGGVCVSKSVYDELSNQDEFDGIELGLQSLKGIGRLIEVYGLKGDKLSEPDPKNYEKDYCGCHSDAEVPSVVILPFKNKGKEEDEFYSYGIWLDLITEVSGAGLIRVASKQQIDEVSDLSYKEIPKRLCVRYIVTGELWKLEEKFQLFIELYDTNESKVVWTDKWQENWENLPTIKGILSDGLLKALDTTSKVDTKVDTTNAEAYEFYLKAKHKYYKRENTDDTEIARGLLQKAIELDDNLILAKNLLGWTYYEMGDYDKAVEIYTPALKQAEELGDKHGIGGSLNNIGIVHWHKGDLDTALDYYGRSLAIDEELGDKHGMGYSLNNIGVVHRNKGDYDKALDYYGRSLKIDEELGDKHGMGLCLNNIGIVYYYKGDYDKAAEYLEKSLTIQREVGYKDVELETTTYLYLTYKHLGKDYDVKQIYTLIKDAENIEFELNLRLYELLDDTSYLETAYNQVQEKASAMDDGAKFLKLRIPKAIVEEWEKVK